MSKSHQNNLPERHWEPPATKMAPNVRFKKARASFSWLARALPKARASFFRWAGGLVTPSDARQRCKNDTKGNQQQQTRRFLLCAKNNSFHWLKRTWGGQASHQCNQFGSPSRQKMKPVLATERIFIFFSNEPDQCQVMLYIFSRPMHPDSAEM